MNRRSNYTSVAGAILMVVALLAVSTSAFAQLPGTGGVPAYAPPFDEVGFIQDAGLGAPNAHATYSNMNRTQAGWLIVNGHTVVVPQNTVLQMPAISVTWADLFDPSGALQVPGTASSSYGGDVTHGGSQTGLAMNDTAPKLPGTFEIHVQGNIVNGTYIAGLIFIAPQSLNLYNGFVTRIDYANGDLYVSGGPGQPETKVQINDPIGRFGKAHSPDQRFSVDEDNPTIHAGTGYPMCVPRFDPAVQPDNLCPQINRPLSVLGGYAMNFTMSDPNTRTEGIPDSNLMAPFEIGDYLAISGMLVPDSTQPSGYYVSAYNIEANVGIYTAPQSDPVYVVLAEMEQGTGGIANVAFPQETTSRVRVEGMSTDSDPGRTIQISARDTDCNGIVSDRAPWISALPIDPGPPTGAKRGRIRWRPAGGPFLPLAKEIHVIANGANTATPTKNGLFPGQYYAPQFTFIFPENLGIGDPPVSLNFTDFVYLANGIGPFGVDGAGNPVVVGQLSPWPDLQPPPATCSYNPSTAASVLTADAGGPYTIQLNASGNGAINLVGNAGVPLGVTPMYKWTVLNQPAGAPALTLSSTSIANPFASIANGASITTPVTYQLSLVVSNSADPLQVSAASVATVTVNPAAQPPVISSITASPSPVVTGGAINVSVVAFDPAGLSMSYTFTSACATFVSQTGSSAVFAAPGTASASCPISVSVSNGAAAPATASTTVAVNAPAGTPTIGAIVASPTLVVSTGSVTLSAAVSDPAGLALSYTWTVLNNATGASFTLTGPTPTFTAPNVTTTGQRFITMSVSLTVKDAAGLTATKTNGATITVTAPPSDTLANNGTLYRTTKSRLTINVNSSVVNSSIILTATLDLLNPATGLPYKATLQNLGGGAYSADIIGVGLPNSIQVVSTGGGAITITRAQITVRN
jgi:hypothetical protein